MEEEDSEPPLHRLCPTYAQDINSPLRHVRTRIYFTSESHVHSLINVLRFCHLGALTTSPSGGRAAMRHQSSDPLFTVEVVRNQFALGLVLGRPMSFQRVSMGCSQLQPPCQRWQYNSAAEDEGMRAMSRCSQCSRSCSHLSTPAQTATQFAGGAEGQPREPLVSEEALQQLWDTPELDYLTHVVFRMYENKR